MSERAVTVATASMNVIHDKKANLAKFLDLMDEAYGADLLVLPEQSLQGYLFGLAHEIESDEYAYHHSHSEPIPGPSTELLAKEAERRNMVLIFGMTERTELGVLLNSAVVLSGGNVVGVYRKIHAPGDEVHLFRHGSRYPVFDTPVGRLGLSICYDMAFPEVSRCLTLAGADILIMPTAWPRFSNYEEAPADTSDAPLGDRHDILCRARAIENQRWYISSNQIGHDDRSLIDWYGHSGIVDPGGEWVAQGGYEEGVTKAEIEVRKGQIDAITGWFDIIRDRRPETYGMISDTKLYEPDPLVEQLFTEVSE